MMLVADAVIIAVIVVVVVVANVICRNINIFNEKLVSLIYILN
jgi:hypothetical protein